MTCYQSHARSLVRAHKLSAHPLPFSIRFLQVKPNQDGFKMMYLRLIGADGKQALPETFNTILSTLTYSWHDTDPWAILGKSIWEGAEVGLDRAFYEFHREMSRLYTWYVGILRFTTRLARFPL
jgi:hypothetical protein